MGEQQGPGPLVGVPVNRPLQQVDDYYGQFGLSPVGDGRVALIWAPCGLG